MFSLPTVKKYCRILAPILFLLIPPCSSHPVLARGELGGASTPPNESISAADSPALPLQPADVNAFFDQFFEEKMQALNVPGEVVVFVQGDQVLAARGYGYADLETRREVDPSATLFQVASVSKLFTATAAMQLVEQERISLNTDVNLYLKSLQVEEAFGSPVTLADLLTHTAGFDERNIGYAAPDENAVQRLADYLAGRLPPRTMTPGALFSYSNHGYGLVGLLVEDISGQPFSAYMKNYVLEPLEMRMSTFELPLPPALAGSLAQGYRWNGEHYEDQELLFRNVPPAGALSATGIDMANFLIAHLNGGRYGSTQILEEETVLTMHARQFTHHPEMSGMSYGFIEQHINGLRAIQHGGDVPGYRSLLFMLPDQQIGFFLAYNASSSNLRREFVEQFMGYFFPDPVTVSLPAPDPQADLSPFTGSYILNRYGHRSLEKLLTLFNGTYTIEADLDGYLVTPDGRRWVETAPMLFQQVDGKALLAFRADEQGRITHLFRNQDFGGGVPGAFEKLPWYGTPRFVNEFYLSWIPFLLITPLSWPLATGGRFLLAKLKRRGLPKAAPGSRAARWLSALFGLGTVWFAAGFIMKGLQFIQQGGGELLFGMPPTVSLLLWIPIIQVAVLAAMVFFTIKAWRSKYWTWFGRLHYSIVTLAAGIWIFFAAAYNLIGHLY